MTAGYSRKNLIFLYALLMLTIASLGYVLWLKDHSITDENALLEGSQSVLLLLTFIVQLIIARRYSKGVNQDIRIGLSFFALALLLREFDVDAIGTSPVWGQLEWVLRGITTLLIAGLLVYALRRIRIYRTQFFNILSSPVVVLSITGCFIYAAGWPFDKYLFDIGRDLSVLVEETLELEATLLFFLAALAPDNRKLNTDVAINM